MAGKKRRTSVKRKPQRKLKTKAKFNLIDLFVRKGKLRYGPVLILIISVLALGIGISRSQQTPSEQPTELPTPGMNYQQRLKWLESMAPYAQKMQQQYGILASISLAQAAHESNWNNSQLSAKYHNFYGVKASKGQASVLLPTSEFTDGHWVKIDAPFRTYPNWEASMLDHTLLLVHGTTDNHQRYAKVLNAPNYTAAANALYQAGYATDPAYAQKLIKIIELYHLNRFDS